MGGKVAMRRPTAIWTPRSVKLFPDAKVVCSATPEIVGNRPLDQVRAPAELRDVDVGVVRAVFGSRKPARFG